MKEREEREREAGFREIFVVTHARCWKETKKFLFSWLSLLTQIISFVAEDGMRKIERAIKFVLNRL